MSIANTFPNGDWNIYRLYQLVTIASQYMAAPMSRLVQLWLVSDTNRELRFDTHKSNYYYTLAGFWDYSVGVNVTKLNPNIATYYIASRDDIVLGFVNESLLSEPVQYQSHFFYKEHTEKNNRKITDFLRSRSR